MLVTLIYSGAGSKSLPSDDWSFMGTTKSMIVFLSLHWPTPLEN